MNLPWDLRSPIAIVLTAILAVALVSSVTKWIILPILGIEWPFRRVHMPWRFSLQSIMVLVGVSAVALAIFRESLDISLLSLVIVCFVWFTVVRYIAFRRSVIDRSRQTLSVALKERKDHDHSHRDD